MQAASIWLLSLSCSHKLICQWFDWETHAGNTTFHRRRLWQKPYVWVLSYFSLSLLEMQQPTALWLSAVLLIACSQLVLKQWKCYAHMWVKRSLYELGISGFGWPNYLQEPSHPLEDQWKTRLQELNFAFCCISWNQASVSFLKSYKEQKPSSLMLPTKRRDSTLCSAPLIVHSPWYFLSLSSFLWMVTLFLKKVKGDARNCLLPQTAYSDPWFIRSEGISGKCLSIIFLGMIISEGGLNNFSLLILFSYISLCRLCYCLCLFLFKKQMNIFSSALNSLTAFWHNFPSLPAQDCRT